MEASTYNSSAAICEKAVWVPVPISTLPLNKVMLPWRSIVSHASFCGGLPLAMPLWTVSRESRLAACASSAKMEAAIGDLKLINDMHGHRVGDEALMALSRELKQMAGPDCMVARIGGDEFGIVLRCG